jgi:hypothetical protein
MSVHWDEGFDLAECLGQAKKTMREQCGVVPDTLRVERKVKDIVGFHAEAVLTYQCAVGGNATAFAW